MISQFRINVRDDIIRNNPIFSHGWGFRANIDVLQPYRPMPEARRIRRRDVYGTLEELINQHGELDTCKLEKKYLGEIMNISERSCEVKAKS